MSAYTDTKHTPEPWVAHDDDGTGTLPCVLANQPTRYGNFYVAQCNVFADARLIAAAPDLLAAARAALTRFREDRIEGYHSQHPVVLLKAAIAKAEGKEE